MLMLLLTTNCRLPHNCTNCGKRESKAIVEKMIPVIDNIYYSYTKRHKWRFVKCRLDKLDSLYIFRTSLKRVNSPLEIDIFTDTNLNVVDTYYSYGPFD